MVKNLPAVQETQVRSLGREDPLEKEMATHASILAWRIPWTEEPGGLESMHGVSKESDTTEGHPPQKGGVLFPCLHFFICAACIIKI